MKNKDQFTKGNVEFEKIEISVSGAGQAIEFSHITEVDHARIIGIMQQFSDETAIPGSSIELDVDGDEVFPKGFESALIYSNESVAPDDRFMRYIDRNVDQVKVTGKYTDGSAQAVFAPYTAHIYLLMRTDKYVKDKE